VGDSLPQILQRRSAQIGNLAFFSIGRDRPPEPPLGSRLIFVGGTRVAVMGRPFQVCGAIVQGAEREIHGPRVGTIPIESDRIFKINDLYAKLRIINLGRNCTKTVTVWPLLRGQQPQSLRLCRRIVTARGRPRARVANLQNTLGTRDFALFTGICSPHGERRSSSG
jgi:hypothetical protein